MLDVTVTNTKNRSRKTVAILKMLYLIPFIQLLGESNKNLALQNFQISVATLVKDNIASTL